MVRTRLAVASAATALVLAGCASGADTPEPVASIATSIPTTSAADAPDSSRLPTDTTDKVSPAAESASLTVVDIRTGRHDGFDRVVYELDGTGMPGWRVGYVDAAVQQGSGFSVELAGEAVLEVLIDGSGYPFDTGVEEFSGAMPILGDPGSSVVEINGRGVFEGVAQSFIGVRDADTPFSVYSLENPTRLVVDIANS